MGDYGVDLNRKWEFNNGDLNIVSDEDNLVQCIQNRLNARKSNFDLFYTEYGGFLRPYLGEHMNNTTLKFIKLEIETILKQDPRLDDFNVDLFIDNGVNCNITVYDSVIDEVVEIPLSVNDNGEFIVEE